MKKKSTRTSIDVDDPQSSSGRRGHKVLYNEKYADETKMCFSDNSMGFKPVQADMWLKEKFPEVLGANNFPSDK